MKTATIHAECYGGPLDGAVFLVSPAYAQHGTWCVEMRRGQMMAGHYRLHQGRLIHQPRSEGDDDE